MVSAASTDVERVFSHGGLIVSKRRHNLSAESTCANVVLNSWSKIDGLIPRKELIKRFNDKSRRQDKDSEVVVVEDLEDVDSSASEDISDDDK